MSFLPLNAIRTFEAAARHLNYSKAAEELCVTPGAVSRAITNLEQHLQLPLFKQQRRKLELTVAGQAYWFEVSQALNRLNIATDEIRQYRGEGGLLVLGVLPTLGERWLIPKLTDFQNRFPNIRLEIKTLPSDFSKSYTELDLESQKVDIALYIHDIHKKSWGGVIFDPLFQERLVPAAAPSCEKYLYALTTGEPNCQQQLLLHTTRPDVWYSWFNNYCSEKFYPKWKARFEHYFMVIQAAINGLGVALLPETLIETEIQNKSLIALTEKPLNQELHYALIYHSVRENESTIRCFVDWLKKQNQSKEI